MEMENDLGTIVANSGGVFKHFNSHYETGIDPTILDMLLIERYGTKTISPFFSKYVKDGKVSSDDMESIVTAICAKFSDYWDSVKLVNGVKVDFENPYNLTHTKTNDVKREGTNENERTENQSMVGYDSSDFTDTSGNHSTGNGKNSSSETGNQTETTKGRTKTVAIASMIQYISLHQRTNIVSAYVDAVGSVLALPTWEN